VAGYSYGPTGASASDRSGELAAVGPVVEIVIRAPGPPLRSPDWKPGFNRESVPARGLIDTGASDVCIDARMAVELGLTETGQEPVGVAGGVSVFSTVYAGILEVPELGFSELMPLYSLKMRHPTHDVLLGRSFLRNFIVTFDGPEGIFHFYRPRGPDYVIEHDE
jgi:predicted aspartyl protease